MNNFLSLIMTRFGTRILSVFSWFKEVHNDPTSNLGSYVRVSGMFVIITTMALVWYSTVAQKDIQPLAQAVLLALITAVLGNYIANKYAKPVAKKQETLPVKKQEQAAEQSTSQANVSVSEKVDV